jgi:hypothetical protein
MDTINEIPAYKAFRIGKDGNPRFLFHGVGKNTSVPLNDWVEAEVKEVRYGAGENRYLSGFHSLPDMDAVRHWGKKIRTGDYVVCRVFLRETWVKTISTSGAILSTGLLVREEDWSNRISLKDIMGGSE